MLASSRCLTSVTRNLCKLRGSAAKRSVLGAWRAALPPSCPRCSFCSEVEAQQAVPELPLLC